MQVRRTVIRAFVFTLLLILSAGIALASNASRIELKDGTVFENVAYRVKNDYKIIVITQGDTESNISFTDIAAIIDSKGRDVTADYIDVDTAPAATGATSTSSNEIPARSLEKKTRPFLFAIHAQPLVSIPIGHYYKGFTTGFGFGGDITVPVSREIAVRATVTRSGIRPGDELSELRLNAWRYVVSIEYYKWPRWRTDGKTMYYIYSGLGAISHNMSKAGNGANESKLISTFGLGVIQQISKNLGVEANTEFDAIFVGTANQSFGYYGDVQYAWILDFKLGLVLML